MIAGSGFSEGGRARSSCQPSSGRESILLTANRLAWPFSGLERLWDQNARVGINSPAAVVDLTPPEPALTPDNISGAANGVIAGAARRGSCGGPPGFLSWRCTPAEDGKVCFGYHGH
jgi:hypothetical protein